MAEELPEFLKEAIEAGRTEAADDFDALIIGDEVTLAKMRERDEAREAKREEEQQEIAALRITYDPVSETVSFGHSEEWWDFESLPVKAVWIRELMLKRERSQIVYRPDGKFRIDTVPPGEEV